MASKLAHEDKEDAPEDWRSNCSSHLAQMSYALEHGVLSDVSFLVGDSKEVIRGHRSILSIGSPVFQALLTGKSFDENPIEIQDVQPNGFKHLLKYLYTGNVPEIPDEDYTEFFRAAKYFMVRRLYPICKENILKKMTTGNALKVYEDGKFLKEKDLEDTADVFIKKNAEAILAEPKFLELSLDNLQHFISSEDFSAKEISICLAVYKWGQAECDRQKLEKTPENLLFVMKNIIPQIRFPLMDPKEFALQIAPLNLLTLEEHVALLTYYIIPQNERGSVPNGGRFISKSRARGFDFVPSFMEKREIEEDSTLSSTINYVNGAGSEFPPGSHQDLRIRKESTESSASIEPGMVFEWSVDEEEDIIRESSDLTGFKTPPSASSLVFVDEPNLPETPSGAELSMSSRGSCVSITPRFFP